MSFELVGRDLEKDAEGFPKIVEYWYDPDTKKMRIYEQQDVESRLNINKAKYNDKDERARYESETLNHVGSIPLIAAQQIQNDTGLDILNCDDKDLRKLLNNSDYKDFRTRPGKL